MSFYLYYYLFENGTDITYIVLIILESISCSNKIFIKTLSLKSELGKISKK